MGRPTRAFLNAQALRHNLRRARSAAPTARVMAVVKANGYGHGLVWVAQTLKEADAFAVASIEEGFQLRQAGIRQPIVLLEGFFSADELPAISHYQLEPVLHQHEQLRMLEAASVATPLTVWVKVDSGMHRVGFPSHEVAAACARLRGFGTVAEIRLMSHFACADDRNDPASRAQLDAFLPLVRELALSASIANSAGILAWAESHLDWIRPGIMLYGASPMLGESAAYLGLQPVMTLGSALISIQRRRRGDAIGYGGSFRCPEDMPVGVVAVGYGDGYPRHAPAGTPVLINGQAVPLVGRVSMDMITLDLRRQLQAKVGDPVILWGEGLPIEDIAQAAGTISYELLTRVAERVPRVAASLPADSKRDAAQPG
ncbi:MAG: alanine racemase [Pseudomonadota bacterium]|nr:MAG: alanine racemase [Pseudomonadota bacterium]